MGAEALDGGVAGTQDRGRTQACRHDLVSLIQGTANATGATVAGADCVGQQAVGPWVGQTYGGWSAIATASGEVLAVGADRDVDVIVQEVTLRTRREL